MKSSKLNKILSLVMCAVLIAALALFTAACSTEKEAPESSKPTDASSAPADSSVPTEESSQPTETADAGGDVIVKGEGATVFTFVTADKDGKETKYEIHTDKKTVGDALLELKIIAGTPGDPGMYIDTVNGVTLDWDKDQMYWAFFENDEYATKGIDLTDIQPDVVYSLIATKG